MSDPDLNSLYGSVVAELIWKNLPPDEDKCGGEGGKPGPCPDPSSGDDGAKPREPAATEPEKPAEPKPEKPSDVGERGKYNSKRTEHHIKEVFGDALDGLDVKGGPGGTEVSSPDGKVDFDGDAIADLKERVGKNAKVEVKDGKLFVTPRPKLTKPKKEFSSLGDAMKSSLVQGVLAKLGIGKPLKDRPEKEQRAIKEATDRSKQNIGSWAKKWGMKGLAAMAPVAVLAASVAHPALGLGLSYALRGYLPKPSEPIKPGKKPPKETSKADEPPEPTPDDIEAAIRELAEDQGIEIDDSAIADALDEVYDHEESEEETPADLTKAFGSEVGRMVWERTSKAMTEDQAERECEQQYPDGIRFTHGSYDSDEASGIFTDSQGGKWNVDVDFGNISVHRIRKSKAVIAVDVHQTLMDDHGPSDSGPVMPGAKEAMERLKDEGHDIAVWTVGDSAGITRWLDDNAIPYDYVNESPLTPEDTDSPKIRADLYVDDKSVLFDGDWDKTLAEVLERGGEKDRQREEWASKTKCIRVVAKGSNPVAAIRAVGEWAEKHPGRMPGYGKIFLKENGAGEVWYVGGDGDEKDFYEECKAKLEAIPGIDEVRYEAESSPPNGEGWIQVYPENEMKTKASDAIGVVGERQPNGTDYWYTFDSKTGKHTGGPFATKEQALNESREQMSNPKSKRAAAKGLVVKGIGKLIGDYDEENNEADFVVSTSGADRDGDTVDQHSLDWREFDANPKMMLAHDTDKIPVGKWLPETRKITKIKDPGTGEEVEATVMRGKFNMHTTEGRETAGSVKDDFLSAASVSFLPQDGGVEKNGTGGSHYTQAKVTEVSVCAVPANQGATRAVEMVLKSYRSRHKAEGQEYPRPPYTIKEEGGKFNIYLRGRKTSSGHDSLVEAEKYIGWVGKSKARNKSNFPKADELLKRADKFRYYGEDYDRNIAVAAGDLQQAVERNQEKFIDMLSRTLESRLANKSKSKSASELFACKSCPFSSLAKSAAEAHKAATGHDVEAVQVADDKKKGSGPGWYVYFPGDDEDEPVMGPFATQEEAKRRAPSTAFVRQVKSKGSQGALNKEASISDSGECRTVDVTDARRAAQARGVTVEIGAKRTLQPGYKDDDQLLRGGEKSVTQITFRGPMSAVQSLISQYTNKSLGSQGALMKLWRKGKTVRVLRKDLRNIVKDEGGAMTEEELMSLVAAKAKADGVELLDEEPKAADDWATEEMPSSSEEDKGLMDPVFDAIRAVGLDPKKLINGPNAAKVSVIIQNGLINGKSKEDIAGEIKAKFGASKASLNDGTPESSYDGDQLDDSATANSNTAMINDNDEPPITADEVVNLAKSAGMPAATAWKVLRGMRGKAKRFKVRVGKRWVKRKGWDASKLSVKLLGDGLYWVIVAGTGAKIKGGFMSEDGAQKWIDTEAQAKADELTDEPDATAMSKDEADLVAEETGGDVMEQQVDQAKGDRAGVGETDDGPDVHVDDPRTGAGEVEGLDEHAPEHINDPRAGPDETANTEPKELTPGETETKDAMQDCVSRKVPIFAKENPDWDQSHVLAASYGYCGEKAKAKGVKPATLRKCWPHVLKALKRKGYGVWRLGPNDAKHTPGGNLITGDGYYITRDGKVIDGPFRDENQAKQGLRNWEGKSKEAEDPAPEAVAAKAKKLIAEGVGRDEAPALAWKILKSQQTKRVQRSKSMDNEDGPKGLRSLRKWKDMIESDCGGMHKAEQGDVMSVGDKIVKLINNVLANKYEDDEEKDADRQESGSREGVGETNDGPNENLDNPDLNEGAPGKSKRTKGNDAFGMPTSPLIKEYRAWCASNARSPSGSGNIRAFLIDTGRDPSSSDATALQNAFKSKSFKCSKSLSKSERDLAKNCKDVLEEMSKSGGVASVLRSALAHAAAKLAKAAGLDDEDAGEEMSKSLSKDQRNAIEEVLATLKSAAEAQDTPKHLKSALNHEAAQLESLSAAKRKEELGEEFAEEMPDDLDQIIPNDLDQEHQEMLSKTFNMLENHSDRMKAIDKAMWDKQGRGYAPNGIN